MAAGPFGEASGAIAGFFCHGCQAVIKFIGHRGFKGQIKLLDGNCIEKSQHRLKELRDISSGPLPGKSLVIYDIERRLPIEVIPCEDGHVQERLLLKALYLSIEKDDVWIADRNFCTAGFTIQIDLKDAFFILREHKQYPYQLHGKEKYIYFKKRLTRAI